MPLTIAFHPLVKHSSLVIKKNLHIFYLDPEACKAFIPEPFIAFRTSSSLKNYLVKAKFPPLAREKGCKKCNKAKCVTCQNIQETDSFACTVDGEQYNINRHFN